MFNFTRITICVHSALAATYKRSIYFFGIILLGTGLSAFGGPIYHGGATLSDPTVNFIWYGNWGLDPTALTLLPQLVTNLSGSSYFNTVASMGVSNQLSFGSNIFIDGTSDNTSLYLGTAVIGSATGSSGSIGTIVNSVFGANLLVDNTHSVYFVLTAPNIAVSGFNAGFCGWHSSINGTASNWGGTHLGTQIGFIGDPASTDLGCLDQGIQGPSGSFGADMMANVITHELAEVVTDPTGRAWWDSNVLPPTYNHESSDMCVGNFGPTYTTADGARANIDLNGTNYLLQKQWVNTGAGTGNCAMSYVSVASVPEPNSLTLVILAVVMLLLQRRRWSGYPTSKF